MTWATFFAGRDDLLALLRFVYNETDCRVREAYSAPDCDAREFYTLEDIRTLPELGSWPAGPHLVLWSPMVSAPPAIRRIDLRPDAIPGHTHRFTVEGCGLITLRCGGTGRGMLNVSHLGWWTEASARAKANPSLRADLVAWPRLTSLARRLRRHVERRLAVATAGRRAVLPEALALARAGVSLRDDTQPRVQFSVDVA